MTTSGITTAAVSLMFGMAMAAPAHADNPCRATAKLADKACFQTVGAEAAIALGKCESLATKDAKKACKAAAKAVSGEGKDDCNGLSDIRKSLCDSLGKEPYAPAIDQASFLSPAATFANPNPYFPLKPGNTWTYTGGGEINVVTVTNATKVVAGVTTIVVHDVVTIAGQLHEETDDFYAQHIDGTVWYFGEISKSFDDEGDLVDVHGSFKAGIDGAQPGIIMEAAPIVGDLYRQEFALGTAEDAAEVLSTTASATAPAASCVGTCVETRDINPFSPGADENKFYAPGIGMILETETATGAVVTELTSFTIN
ncbi:MAG: hypothetical protein ABIR79_01315 [Candidatus Binatia bacterium]